MRTQITQPAGTTKVVLILAMSFCPFLLQRPWVHAQSLGAQGELSSARTLSGGRRAEKPSLVQSFDYTVELFPGQVFAGWFYYWSQGGHLEANLKVPQDASWLTVAPSGFSSDSCSQIVPVEFDFTAPMAPGDYVATVTDSNGSWDDTRVTCRVTNTPTIPSGDTLYIDRLRAEFNADTVLDTVAYIPRPLSCVDYYAPAGSIDVFFWTNPPVSWLDVEPDAFSLPLGYAAIVKWICSDDTTGGPSTYAVSEMQYYSHPAYSLVYRSTAPTAIQHLNNETHPGQLSLLQNYPNPFNPTTIIRYRLRTNGYVTLQVFDALGKEVMILKDGYEESGEHQAVFNGAGLASGAYFYRLTSGGSSEKRGMLLVK